MSKDQLPQDDQTLNFDEARNLTIEEAVQREADLAAGVTEQDGVLDKYIKKNRDKVGERKFDSQPKQLTNKEMMAALDSFIHEHRKELTDTGTLPLVSEPTVGEADGVISPKPEVIDFSKVSEETPETAQTFYGDTFTKEKPVYRHKKAIIGGLAALLLTTVGLAYGVNQLNQSSEANKTASTNSVATSQSSTSEVTSTTDSSEVEANTQAFEDLYKTFFADEEQTKPLNSSFEALPQLEEALKKLEGTSAYEAAKSKYDGLVKAVTAIKAVNDKFETPAIVDGEKVAATLKPGANLDELTASVVNTGKANLDSLIQGVITEGRGVAQTAATPSSTVEATPAAPVAQTTPATPEPTAPAVVDTPSQLVAGDFLQRQLSRVPYNNQAIADSQNPAWAFNPGVLEEILRVSRERGYFAGNDYILEPVNIVNGNGYYNLFKSDGTYLFSLNAKTGYFVGNAPGRADALDY